MALSAPVKTYEQRRFPRARVQRALSEVIAALGARLMWPNHEVSEVSDLSYKGFAVTRPGLFPIAVKSQVDLKVELGNLPAFLVQARIAWCTQNLVGLEVLSLPPEGHLAMGTFLDAKLLGTRLKPVERAFIGAQQSFQYWFQGPQDTHVFVWVGAAQAIMRVTVTMNGISSEFERGMGLRHPTAEERQALLVLSQMDKETLPMEEFVRSLGAPSGV